MFELGTEVTDTATGQKGTLTHMQIQLGGARWYDFQPGLLDKKTGAPVTAMWITEARVKGKQVPDPELPLDALGTEATDSITGFKGTVTGIIIHINGCVHLEIQPKTKQENGALVLTQNFDIRLLKGPKIPKITKTEKAESRKKNPSPALHGRLM